MDHVFQKVEDNLSFFGAYLNFDQRSPVRGKVISIANIYKNCQFLDKSTLKPVQMTTFDDNENIVEKIANHGPTLFKLVNEDSPFMKQLIWFPKNSNYSKIKGTTTEYFQYSIYVNNSAAMHPLQ